MKRELGIMLGISFMHPISHVKRSDRPSEMFYESMTIASEYGNCCWIPPYLYFEDDRGNLEELTTQEWLNISKGFASNGLQNGLTLTMEILPKIC